MVVFSGGGREGMKQWVMGRDVGDICQFCAGRRGVHGRGDAFGEGLQQARTVDFLLVERVLGHIVVAHVSPKLVRVGEVVGPGRVGEDDGVVLGVGAGSGDPFLGSAWQLRDVEDGGVGIVHGGVGVDGVSREVVWEMEVTVALFWKFPMNFLGRLDAVRAK